MNFQETMLEATQVDSFKDFVGTEDREVLVRDSNGVRFGIVFLEGDDWVLVNVPGSDSIRLNDGEDLPENTEFYIMPEGTDFLGI